MVEFSGKLNGRINKKLAEHQSRKVAKSMKTFCLALLVLGLALCTGSLINGLETDTDIVLFGLGLFGIIFWFVFPRTLKKTAQKAQNKQNTLSIINDETNETYKFDEEKVYIFTEQGNKFRSAIETNYDYFTNIVEDDDCYIFFITKIQCHVVFKDGLRKGSLEEMNGYIKKHFSGEKYERILPNIKK